MQNPFPFPFPLAYAVQGGVGLGAILAIISCEAGAFWTSRQSIAVLIPRKTIIKTHILTYSQLQSSVYLM